MIRRGRYKYIHSEIDPPLLFDVDADPHELRNLVGSSAAQAMERMFREEVACKWDSGALTEEILLSQRRRRLVQSALSRGQPVNWEYNLSEEISCFRGQTSYNEWAFSSIDERQ
jgi:choline-sulfatase